jgi:lysozyme
LFLVITKKLASQKVTKRATSGRNKPARKPARRKKASRKWKVSPWLVAGLVLLVAAGVLAPYIRYGRFASEGATVPDGARSFCVDLSHHNTGIVWDSLKVVVDRTGHTTKDLLRAKSVFPVSSVILKATEGEKFTDRRFNEYWEEAGKRDFPRGAYHFFRSSRHPEKQAQHYISQVKLRHSDLPPVLDVETMHEGCTKQELNEKVLVWLRTVEKHYGRTPIVYTSDSYARDILSPEITQRYPMWIARYNRNEPKFKPWTMWQFTDKAVLYGASGYVDLSVIP